MNDLDIQGFLDFSDLFFDNLLFLALAHLFALKGLNFRRITLLGRMLSAVALSVAVVYLLAFVAQWWNPAPFLWIRRGARLMLLFYLVQATFAMSWTYGGWIPMHQRAWRNLREIIRLRRIPVEYGPADRYSE